MKEYICLLFIVLPLFANAQTSGGQITRNKANTTTVTAKEKHSSSISKKTNNGNRRSTSGGASQKAITSMGQAQKDFIIGNLIANMVPVKGGTFTMGATSEQGGEAAGDEKPTHRVTLSPFSIGKFEVTQEEWQAVMGNNPSYFKGEKRPVENVSHHDCWKFIHKLNSMTGKKFRLPTEAEWEFAARGGNLSNAYKYAGCNILDDVAWYDSNSSGETHNVGRKQPNELGLYDMSGNVWEWCQDWYVSYGSSSKTNPVAGNDAGASTAIFNVVRGGSRSCNAASCRVSRRNFSAPNNRFGDLGFRLAH